MATAKTTIELNGKLYDARSGKIIGGAQDDTAVARIATPPKTNGMVLDGFMRRPQAQSTLKPKPSVSRSVSTPAKTKLEKSKTLMRPAVKKPKAIIKHEVTSAAKHAHFKKEDPARLNRAAAVPKSSLIQKFNPVVQAHTVIKKEAALAVASPATPISSQPSSLSGQVAKLATSAEAQVMQSVDIIEESLRQASAHLEKFEDEVLKQSIWERFGFKHKIANIATVSLACLLLVGFFGFQNASNIEMRVAAARSGVSANMPGYKPAGFSAARGIKTEPGKVTVTFASHTDDKQFTVSQQASNWSSESLLVNHVLANKQPYQTYQDEGKTVYIYDNSNATWVNGGIWYRVDGNASLTSDQLLRIANSL